MSRNKTYFLDHDPSITDLSILHKDGCYFIPANSKRLGSFEDDSSAIKEARSKYQGVMFCPLCCGKVLSEV
ncbi:MAG TPA: hypothetical protein VHO50_07085 [Bacteroidales bacterium]|nr:hypothetical protein [Bacteroidales bacterium]